MEHAQRETERIHGKVLHLTVLILILMEHAQRGVNLKSNIYDKYVLILILMEHAQRGMFIHSHSCVY